MLDRASFRTLYVGALRDSRWPTLSAFLAGNGDIRAKNTKIPDVGQPVHKNRLVHRIALKKLVGHSCLETCQNLALDQVSNLPAKRAYGTPRLRSQTLVSIPRFTFCAYPQVYFLNNIIIIFLRSCTQVPIPRFIFLFLLTKHLKIIINMYFANL